MEQEETKKTVDTENKDRTRYFHCALQLARMYGVAETLHPIPYLPMEEFVSLMETWAAEQETRQETSILAFFEEKMAQKRQEKGSF